jgi:hypothetical protein
MKRICVWFASLLAVLQGFALQASAQELDLVGDVKWQLYRKKLVAMGVDVIQNHRSTTSGSLQLQVWATTDPYESGTLHGFSIGTFSMNPLRGGYYYQDIWCAVKYYPPPAGIYYTTMTLEEYQQGEFYIYDHFTFDEPVNFGWWGQGATTVEPTGPVCLSGGVRWDAEKLRVRCRVEKILNNTVKRSGRLRLELWSLPNPFDGVNANGGVVLCRKSLPRLQSGSERPIDCILRFRPPAYGYCNTVMVLRELQGHAWNVVSFANFPDLSFF